MIHLYRWDPAENVCRPAGPDALPTSHAELAGGDVLWVDLDNPTPEEEDRVFRQFLPVHPLTLEDLRKPRAEPEQGAHFPKVEEFADYLFVVVNPLPPGVFDPPAPGKELPSPPRLSRRTRPQLSAVLTHHALITHHYDPLPAVAGVREHAARHAEAVRRGPDYVFHLILDATVDEYAPVVERLADRLDALETQLFRRPSPDLLRRLIRLKRRVAFLRKTLILEREVLFRLTRGEFKLIEDREIAYYRNVYDHLVRYSELTEAAREMVSDLMQTHLSVSSNRLSEVMKVLTMISTAVLPMTLVAGVYGMNFRKGMPELDWEYGYPWALGLMAAMALAALALFRWKRWI
jgi:magnesium transporter